jgi:hypothetical protein
VNIWGLVKLIYTLSYKSALCKNPPYNDNDTKAALPIAKPFPIAAVVLPAASRPSVRARTYYPSSAI